MCGYRQAGRGFPCPEIFRRDGVQFYSTRRGCKIPAYHIGINDHATTYGPIQSFNRPRPSSFGRADIASADLAAGKDVGAINVLSLRVQDAIQVTELGTNRIGKQNWGQTTVFCFS